MTVTATVLDDPYQTRFTAGAYTGLANTRKGGVGGASGMRPHELLEAALATCMAITARMAAESVGMADPRAAVRVRLERCPTSTITRYRLTVDPRLDDAQRAEVIARVERSPVIGTLRLPVVVAADPAIAPPAPP
jgi:putative redox protein